MIVTIQLSEHNFSEIGDYVLHLLGVTLVWVHYEVADQS